ncbi:hypothetical protein Q0F98_30570 [Paenibacillus amylolyticus]|nr:hypothetical protein Q0F98_30570 [Paenibacillus amylolyticus]
MSENPLQPGGNQQELGHMHNIDGITAGEAILRRPDPLFKGTHPSIVMVMTGRTLNG